MRVLKKWLLPVGIFSFTFMGYGCATDQGNQLVESKNAAPSDFKLTMVAVVGNKSTFVFDEVIERKECLSLPEFAPETFGTILNELPPNRKIREELTIGKANTQNEKLPNGSVIKVDAVDGSVHSCYIARKGRKCLVIPYLEWSYVRVPEHNVPLQAARELTVSHDNRSTKCTIKKHP